jgi:tetratricopeptide (TPR) repeat protein
LTTALAYWGHGYLHILAGEAPDALQWAERELSMAERFQFPLFVGQALFQIGWAQFQLGERAAGMTRMEDGITAIRRTGAEMGLPYFMALHAEALSALGRTDEAAGSIRAAIDLGLRNGTHFQLAEVLTIEALIKEQLGASPADVEKWLRRAIKVASTQRSRTGELLAVKELAGRLSGRGRKAEAAKLMAGHVALLEQLGSGLPT